MSAVVDIMHNNITPNKRKRETSLFGHSGKENRHAYDHMEVKSLRDLLPTSNTQKTTASAAVAVVGGHNNAFEVTRKPPKKKSKLSDASETQCFVNAALDLNGPDHVVNPFEIRRSVPTHQMAANERSKCFVNTALNIRAPEKEVRNPFEIVRQNVPQGNATGHDNAAMSLVGNHHNHHQHQMHSPHISRAIAIPFTPTIGCRIDFNNVPLESLTPCTLLAKKLVFSPAPPNAGHGAGRNLMHQYQNVASDSTATATATPRPSDDAGGGGELSVISEESLDIIAELDCYQLELENSINEAKIKKRGIGGGTRRSSGAGRGKNLMDFKNRKSFATLLSQADDRTDDDDADDKRPTESEDLSSKLTPKLTVSSTNVNAAIAAEAQPATGDSSGVDYEEIDEAYDDAERQLDDRELSAVDDGDFAFRNPAPFVRTYKRKSVRRPATAKPISAANSEEAIGKSSNGGGIGQSIRNSIRRLIKSQPKKAASAEQVNANVSDDAMPAPASRVFATLRQSLRRKPKQADMPERCDHETSVMCDTERKVFRAPKQTNASTSAADMAWTKSNEELGHRRAVASSLRSSIRNKTKDVRRQMMRSMFNKNTEDYQFE